MPAAVTPTAAMSPVAAMPPTATIMAVTITMVAVMPVAIVTVAVVPIPTRPESEIDRRGIVRSHYRWSTYGSRRGVYWRANGRRLVDGGRRAGGRPDGETEPKAETNPRLRNGRSTQ